MENISADINRLRRIVIPICKKTTDTMPKPTISETPFIGKLNRFLSDTSTQINIVAKIIATDAAHANDTEITLITQSIYFKNLMYIPKIRQAADKLSAALTFLSIFKYSQTSP